MDDKLVQSAKNGSYILYSAPHSLYAGRARSYLVKKGIAFRDSHATVGKIVQHAIQSNCLLSEIKLEVFQSFSKLIDKDVYEILSLEGSLNSRTSYGGTSPSNIEVAIKEAKQRLFDVSP